MHARNANTQTTTDLAATLMRLGLVASPAPQLTPLTGGVSSEIYLVEDGDRRFVVKRALSKLRVQADWFADPSRNAAEFAFIQKLAEFRPDAVPKLLPGGAADGFFCMEYLDGFANWKTDLIHGQCDFGLAGSAGRLLGDIYTATRDDPAVRSAFDTGRNFDQLRLDPYLRAAAEKNPQVAPMLYAEVERLGATRESLVHGDFSPKNLLHQNHRLVLVDCEVAWFGDPAFDLAFLLNHLFLKALFHRPAKLPFQRMVQSALDGFRSRTAGAARSVELRAAGLLPMLLLARVDGKSPVEYLDPPRQNMARQFAVHAIQNTPESMEDLTLAWFSRISTQA